MARTCATYPITIEAATDIIIELRLPPSQTIIEPSPSVVYLFDDLRTATEFRLRFDAERLAYADPAQFLMCVDDDEDLDAWLRACSGEYQRVEFVTVQFGSEEDRARFEEGL